METIDHEVWWERSLRDFIVETSRTHAHSPKRRGLFGKVDALSHTVQQELKTSAQECVFDVEQASSGSLNEVIWCWPEHPFDRTTAHVRRVLARRGRAVFVCDATQVLLLNDSIDRGLSIKRWWAIHKSEKTSASLVFLEAKMARPGGVQMRSWVDEVERA